MAKIPRVPVENQITTLTRKVREVCVADFDEAVIYCRELKVTYIYFFFSANTHVKGVKTTLKVYPQIPFFPDISVST